MILASFTMGIHNLFLGFLLLYLTGVRGEDTKTHLIISNQIYTSQNNLELTCQDACDESGEIIDCMLKASGKCLSRYYLVCLRDIYGECKTINSSCPDQSGTFENKCQEAINAKEEVGGNTRRQSRRFMRSNILGMNRFNDLNRRDLRSSEEGVQMFSPKSAMVASSGNGHAFAMDGDKLVQSHFGGPPVVSSVNSGGKTNSIMNFPFAWMSSMSKRFRSGFDPNVQQSMSQEPDLYGQSQYTPYRTQGAYRTVFPEYGMHDYRTYYGNEYGKGVNPYWRSPFGTFFSSVGLQDPTLMFQYLANSQTPPNNPYQPQEPAENQMGDWMYVGF